MEKKYWLVTFLSLGLIVACGEDRKKEFASEKKYEVETIVATEPMADTEQTAEMVVRVGKHKYQISIHRFPDESLPIVVDELEQRFYDNSVEIKILRDGEDFLFKKLTKNSFSEFLSENDLKSGMLLGMNCDTTRQDKSVLHFTAQVGQAGEGPAFLMLVPINGGEVRFSCDELQEDIGYKQ